MFFNLFPKNTSHYINIIQCSLSMVCKVLLQYMYLIIADSNRKKNWLVHEFCFLDLSLLKFILLAIDSALLLTKSQWMLFAIFVYIWIPQNLYTDTWFITLINTFINSLWKSLICVNFNYENVYRHISWFKNCPVMNINHINFVNNIFMKFVFREIKTNPLHKGYLT